jgi:FixJ family two-component response regulator
VPTSGPEEIIPHAEGSSTIPDGPTAARAPTVFVVDDEDGVRTSLARLFRSAGWQTEDYPSAAAFLSAYDPEISGCLVLDFAMPGLDGIELQGKLRDMGSELPIVFLTGHAEVPDSVTAMKQGALDFLTKPAEPDDLKEAVRRALTRDAEVRRERAELVELRRRTATLTPREREVFEHVVTGQLNKQIARDLGTAEKTIRIHRGRVMRKMGASSLAELVRMAERLGV